MRTAAPRTRSRRTYGLAAAVLALGLAGGAGAATSLALAADDAKEAALAVRTASVRSALDATLSRYADTLHDLAAAPPADSAALARAVGNRLAGAHQVLVVDAGFGVLARHTADGSNPPPHDRLSPEPELARTMSLAREHGRPVTSAAHDLPADAYLPPAARQRAFEMAAPVHRAGAFAGWVIVSVRANDLLDASMAAGNVTGVAATLFETSADGVSRPIASWRQGTGAAAPARRVDVRTAGGSWQVEIQPTTPLVSPARETAAPLVLVGAAVLSLGVAALLLTGAPGDRRALERAVREAEDRADAAEAAARAVREVESRAEAAARAVREAESRAEAAEAAARAAETARRDREAELSGFTATATEHLHAPLHTIAGFTEILLEDAAPGLDEESRGFLRRVDAAARRMIALVDDLATYSGSSEHALKLEPLELSMLALDVAADHLTPAREELPSIELGELPAVEADAVLLRQVLAQLVGNAVRYVREGTPARVTIGAVELPGGWWRVEVADRGIGVPEEQRDSVFAPFRRASSAAGYPGKGLGLAVAARIVALHGGEIGLRPNPGGGSVFWFTVPGVSVPSPAPAAI